MSRKKQFQSYGTTKEMTGEFFLYGPDHAQANCLEIPNQAPGLVRQATALPILAADLGLDKLPDQSLLRALDAAPNVAVAFANVGSRLLD
jgi:hypothetical protein